MSFGMIPLSPDDKPDSFVLLSMYEKLESENAKLREDLEDQEGYDQILRDRLRQQTELCVKAEAENAKLRELVRHLYEYRQLYFKTGIYPTDHGVTEQRMRELGVEYSDNG